MPTFEGVEGNENRNKERNIGGIFLAPLTLEKFSAMMQKIKYNSG